MGLAHVELAPFIGAYDLVGVGDRCGPVEALVERVAHEGARCRVMATHAYVDVPDELPAMGKGMQGCRTPDAAQLYSSLSITVNDLAFLAMRLASVRPEGSSPRSIQVRYLLCQSSARGGASVSMASALSTSNPRVGRARTPHLRGRHPWVPHLLDLKEPLMVLPNSRIPCRGRRRVWRRLTRKRSGER
jgi:hypothetical protein